MSSKKKDKNCLKIKIYRDRFVNVDDNDVLLPYKVSDKIPEEMIENEIPKWCEPGDPLYEFLKEQIKKKHGNSGVIFCPYVPSVSVKDPEKEEN